MCDCEEAENFVKVKFVGGFHKRGLERGPYLSYTTGDVYVLPERYADQESYPYFEYIEDASEDEIEEPWRSRLGLKPIKRKPKEVFKVTGSTAEEEPLDLEALSGEVGMTEFNESTVITPLEMLTGMDLPTLRMYVQGQGGKVDNRWGRNKLIEEAMKLQ